MTRTYTYQLRRISPRQHAALQALFVHMGSLRNHVVAKYRDYYKEGRKTASYYDLTRWLTELRCGSDERTRRTCAAIRAKAPAAGLRKVLQGP